jgi:hypothetical protein
LCSKYVSGEISGSYGDEYEDVAPCNLVEIDQRFRVAVRNAHRTFGGIVAKLCSVWPRFAVFEHDVAFVTDSLSAEYEL